MFNYTDVPVHQVLCVDMKSFYASCECVFRGLDPLRAKVAVVGDLTQKGSVVLASSPSLKKAHGIKTGSRLYEIERLHDPSIMIFQAQMGKYLTVSKQIQHIFEQFVPPSHIHIYSVDEAWLTLDGTEKLWGNSWAIAHSLIQTIFDETGIPAAVGIGNNKFLAKAALDNFAKQKGIDEITYEQVVEKLHPLPIEKMWGCGKQLTKRFHEIGIQTIGELADAPPYVIRQLFGKNGMKLYGFAWGIDPSPVVYKVENKPQTAFGFDYGQTLSSVKSIGRGITLGEDYCEKAAIYLIITELIQEVCYQLRKQSLTGKTIHLSVSYSRHTKTNGFSRQKSMTTPTDDPSAIYQICHALFEHFYQESLPVRFIRVSISRLFALPSSSEEDRPDQKRKQIEQVVDHLNHQFGKGTIRKASSLMEKSMAIQRSKKVNGHYK